MPASRPPEPPPAPLLGVRHVVEREHVEAGDLPALEHRAEPVDQRVGTEAPAEEATGEAAVLPQEPERVADPDPGRHAEELRPRHRPRDAHVDREPGPPRPDVLDPPGGDRGVEANLARDV